MTANGSTLPGPAAAPAGGGGNRRVHAAAACVWLMATAAAWLARETGQPLTSGLVYLFGIILIGALEGLRGGIVAGIAASLFYNFFLTDPLFRFTFGSADELVPLIAFNASAVAAGLISGRLHDRALAAEAAIGRLRDLLAVSERFQGAIEVEALVAAIAGYKGLGRTELFLLGDGAPVAVGPVPPAADAALAAAASAGDGPMLREGKRQAWRLATAAGPSGVLVTRAFPPGSESEADAAGVIGLLALALERCLLHARLSEAELIRRSETLKTALLSSVSHDLRTPLSAISASASSLERYGAELGDAVRDDLLRLIRAQCDRLDRYTTNLLNLGRIQAGVDPSQFTGCDALEVMGAALSNLRGECGGREFRKDYSGAAETIVRADPVMLEQVFFNLLDNAARYSPEGTPILIRACSSRERLDIEIADCGAGIEPGDEDRVFERFYRASTGKAGSGLGLSIARGFTEAFGGTIEMQRGEPPFAGARVRISLPLDREALAA